MNYPNTQTPMTTNFDSYMDLKRFENQSEFHDVEMNEVQRRRTSIEKTFEYIKKKFGRRKTISYNH